MPTLREFIDAAVKQNCKYGELQGEIVGPRGHIKARYLVSRTGVIYPLPEMADGEHLDPTTIWSMVRVLHVSGYEHLIAHLEKDYFSQVDYIDDDDGKG
jgi:hypothetical protein